MNLQVDIVKNFHFEDDTHGFAGELYYDEDQFLGEFINYGGNRRWSFQWESPQAFLRFAGVILAVFGLANLWEVVKNYVKFNR